MAKLTTQEFANLFLFEAQIIANKINAVSEEIKKNSPDYIGVLEDSLARARKENSFYLMYDPNTVKDLEKKQSYTQDFIEDIKKAIAEGTYSKEFAKAKQIITGLEAEIESLKKKINSDSHQSYLDQKKEERDELSYQFRNLQLLASLPIRARLLASSDNEINALRNQLLGELNQSLVELKENKNKLNIDLSELKLAEEQSLKDFAATKKITGDVEANRRKQAEIEQQIIDISEEISEKEAEVERLDLISVSDLRNELAQKAQRTFYEAEFWAEKIKKSSEYWINKEKEYHTRELNKRYPDEEQYLLEVYQRVLKNGVNPRNIIFAGLMNNDKKIEQMLNLANEYKKLIIRKRQASTPKFMHGELGDAFYNVFDPHDEFLIAETNSNFWDWLNINSDMPVDEIISNLKIKIEELKQIDEQFAQQYPDSEHDPYVDGPHQTVPKTKGGGYVHYFNNVNIGPDFIAFLEEIKQNISETEYNELVVKFNQLKNLKRQIIKSKKTQDEIYKLEAELVTASSTVINNLNDKIRQAKLEARVKNFVQSKQISNDKITTGYAFGFANTMTATFPQAVRAATNDFDKFLARLEELAKEAKNKNEEDNKKIDEEFKSILNQIKMKCNDMGIPTEIISTNPYELFPETDKDNYTNNDVYAARQNYFIEQEISKMIDKLKMHLPEETPTDSQNQSSSY